MGERGHCSGIYTDDQLRVGTVKGEKVSFIMEAEVLKSRPHKPRPAVGF